MTNTANSPLIAALAKLQADLPRITKGETAQIKGDKGSFSYKYADLTDVSAEVLPRLGKLGLCFTARPTLADDRLVLSYSLIHECGERIDGTYPLPQNGTPQQLGSAITYGRRYTLCAVTGVAPGGDDDDATAAQAAAGRSASDAWETATPARPAETGWYEEALTKASVLKTETGAQELWRASADAAKNGRCTPREATHIQNRIKLRMDKLRQDAAPVNVTDLTEVPAENPTDWPAVTKPGTGQPRGK